MRRLRSFVCFSSFYFYFQSSRVLKCVWLLLFHLLTRRFNSLHDCYCHGLLILPSGLSLSLLNSDLTTFDARPVLPLLFWVIFSSSSASIVFLLFILVRTLLLNALGIRIRKSVPDKITLRG